MRSFNLQPVAGETYNAALILPDGTRKIYHLPFIKKSGTSISVINPEKNDSLEIIISCTADIADSGNHYYLIGQSRGVVCVGANIMLKKKVTKLTINKSNFPTGITRFTLLNTNKQPLNERITFIDHEDRLNIKVSTKKSAWYLFIQTYVLCHTCEVLRAKI